MSKVVLVALVALAVCAPALAAGTTATAKSFKKDVLQDDGVVFVEFFAPVRCHARSTGRPCVPRVASA